MQGDRTNYGRGKVMTRITLRLTPEEIDLLATIATKERAQGRPLADLSLADLVKIAIARAA